MSIRELVSAATPGPWVACGDKRGGCQCGNVWSVPGDVPVGNAITEEKLNEAGWSRNRREQQYDDARLIALAPELAVLAADMADALDQARDCCARPAGTCGDFDALLARFRALDTAQPEQEPAA